jgi:hypothetical protein
MVIWYIFPVLVFCTKKNLATLVHIISISENSPYSWIAPFVNKLSMSDWATLPHNSRLGKGYIATK